VAAKKAVQIDHHRQLRPDPAGLGQPAALQAAAGQLGQRIGPPLATAAGVVAIGGLGQGSRAASRVPSPSAGRFEWVFELWKTLPAHRARFLHGARTTPGEILLERV
jgi:hypothetical protein